jgi:hypothetical protein
MPEFNVSVSFGSNEDERAQTPSSSVARKKERLRRRLQKREKKGLTVEVGDAYIRKIGDEEV